jgi:hypothetical protein
MAKKRAKIDSDLFSKTEPDQDQDPTQEKLEKWIEQAKTGQIPADPDVPLKGQGVGLKPAEIALLRHVADTLGDAASLSAVMRYGLRYFLSHYYTGKVDPAADVKPAVKDKLSMP